jgi:hypothetical protein
MSGGWGAAIGSVPSAFDCYLAHRGLKTLPLRMEQHQRNALAVARALEASPHVISVIYPGLPSHPQHALACAQQSGFGGMVSFNMRGDAAAARRFFDHTRLFTLAESLGGIESLSEIPYARSGAPPAPCPHEARGTMLLCAARALWLPPGSFPLSLSVRLDVLCVGGCSHWDGGACVRGARALMTHLSVKPEDRAKLGITDTLIRLSCGIEDTEDLVAVRPPLHPCALHTLAFSVHAHHTTAWGHPFSSCSRASPILVPTSSWTAWRAAVFCYPDAAF